LGLANACYGCLKSFKLFGWPRLQWTDAGHRQLGYASFVALVFAAASGLYNKVMLFPGGFGGGMAKPSAAWLAPGGTWSYAYLGHAGVYASLAALFWVAYLALEQPATLDADEPGEAAEDAAEGYDGAATTARKSKKDK
jgi:hypothetical protein